MEELELMRSQLAILKEKLEKETIISDKLLREVTRQKVRRLNRNVWQMGIWLLIFLPIGNLGLYLIGCSWWFTILANLLVVIEFLCLLIPHSRIKQKDIMSSDLSQVAKQIQSLRNFYSFWQKITIPISLLWLGLVCIELYHIEYEDFIPLTICCIMGMVVGLLANWIKHKRYLQEMDDIIKQIEE